MASKTGKVKRALQRMVGLTGRVFVSGKSLRVGISKRFGGGRKPQRFTVPRKIRTKKR